jgi:hypothetical protein
MDQYTKLYLDFEDFTDKSFSNKRITSVGTTIDQSIKKFGNSCIYFNGNSYLTIPNSADLDFGTEDFTIECFVMRNYTKDSVYKIFLSHRHYIDSLNPCSGMWLGSEPINDYLQFSVYTTSTNNVIINTNYVLPINKFIHICVVRKGIIVTLFADGVIIGQGQINGWYNATTDWMVGTATNGTIDDINNTPYHYFIGWMDCLRISKGIARYTSTFTPPTTPYISDEYTKLLLHGNNFTDGSITAIKPIDIYNNEVIVDTTIKKFGIGSYHFSTNEQYLTFPYDASLALNSNDFTIDLWVNFDSWQSDGNSHTFIKQMDNASNFWTFELYRSTESKLIFYDYKDGVYITNFSCSWNPSLHVWYHIAIVRNINNVYLFIDGISQIITISETIAGKILGNTGSYYISGNGSEYSILGYLDEIRISNIARWTSNFTPSSYEYTIDEYTRLLLHCDDIVMINGTVTIDNIIKKISSGSLNFTNSGYLSISNTNDWDLGNEDFSIDSWIYPTVESLSGIAIGKGSSDTWETQSFSLGLNNGTPTVVVYYNSGMSKIELSSSNNQIPINTWTHIAAVRNNSNIYLFVNGILCGTNSDIGTYSVVTSLSSLYIGRGENDTNPNYFIGNIDEVRISKGIAYWIGNFTLQTSPYIEDSYTKLLLHCDGFSDSAPSNKVLINTNTTIDTSYRKLGSGSLRFNGSNSFLTVPSSIDFDMRTTNFTLEFYIKFNTLPNVNESVSYFNAGPDNDNQISFSLHNDTNQFVARFFTNNGSSSYNLFCADISISVGEWYHFAYIVIDNMIKFFLDGIEQPISYLINSGTESEYIDRDVIPDISFSEIYIGKSILSNQWLNANIDEYRFSKIERVSSFGFEEPSEILTRDKYTSLLANFEDVKDSSEEPKSITNYAVLNCIMNKKINNTSLYFDGSKSYLDIAYNTDFDFGTDDFTIDFWINVSNINDGVSILTFMDNTNSLAPLCILINNGIKIYMTSSTGNTWDIADGLLLHDVDLNSWHHIAIVRDISTIKLYYDGINTNLINTSASLLTTGKSIIIGNSHYNEYNKFNGYIDEFRISKGIARWNNNFTPQTIPYISDIYTKLLIHCNAPNDESFYHKTLINTNTNIYQYGKYGKALAISAGTYLEVKSDEDLSIIPGQDFTIDWWEYHNVIPTLTYLTIGNSDDYTGIIIYTAENAIYPTISIGTGDTWVMNDIKIGNTLPIGSWVHRAIVRKGTIYYAFENGILSNTFEYDGIINCDNSIRINKRLTAELEYATDTLIDEFRFSKIARWIDTFIPPFTSAVREYLLKDGSIGNTNVIPTNFYRSPL